MLEWQVAGVGATGLDVQLRQCAPEGRVFSGTIQVRRMMGVHGYYFANLNEQHERPPRLEATKCCPVPITHAGICSLPLENSHD